MKPDQKILDELVKRILSVVQPVKIILFGSAVRGIIKPGSDIDVLVVVPNGVHRRKTAQNIYMNLFGLGVAVDVVVSTENDLRDFGENFSLVYYPALREGIELYVA